MRAILAAAPALLLLTACSAPRLSRPEAEQALKALYPVDITLEVPSQGKAIKGSPQHAQLVAQREHLMAQGFTVARQVEGDWETFQFNAPPALRQGIRAVPGGFQVVVAKAEFVKALKLEPTKKSARVTYLVKLGSPSPHFALFQQLNPNSKVGATKERHATFILENRTWKIQETDEKGRK